mmetsp:Transcript_64976/g.89263  ORF Transcript_64976/g.89263 Transcript_64976/m.89263 type:complete len:411 (-) Transcript_64976:361-1593(-)
MIAPSWTALPDLSSENLGTEVIFATDEWFATADRLLLMAPPVFLPDEYTEVGKWMDGWESRRKRIPGHDWCIIRLGQPGNISGVVIDTAHFTGNHSPRFSLQGACLEEVIAPLEKLRQNRADPDCPSGTMGSACSLEETALAESIGSEQWVELVPVTALQPGYPDSRLHYFEISNKTLPSNRFTHLRLNMYPDGGIARLHVHGVVARDWQADRRADSTKLVDLVSVLSGGFALGCSNQHFGKPGNLIGIGRGVNMGDGWETARHPDRPSILRLIANQEDGLLDVPGSDWSVLCLGVPGIVHKIEIDTAHFKGNFPESCKIDACLVDDSTSDATILESAKDDTTAPSNVVWMPLLPRTKLGADRVVTFELPESSKSVISHVRLTMLPDGGISRLRLWGLPDEKATMIRSRL